MFRRDERIKRNTPGSFIIASIVYIVLGVFMVMHPGKVENTLCIGFGVLLTIYGVINVISFFLNRNSDDNLFFELVFGVIAAAFGIYTLFNPTTVIKILLIIVGVIIIIDGAINLKRSFHLREFGVKKWYFYLLLSAISIVMGIITIVFREPLGEALVIVLGVTLIYQGITSLIILFQISRNKKRVEHNLMMIDADYTDRD